MSLELRIEDKSIVDENEHKVKNFIINNLNNDVAIYVFGMPENKITKRYRMRPCGHNGKTCKPKFKKYTDLKYDKLKLEERNYMYI